MSLEQIRIVISSMNSENGHFRHPDKSVHNPGDLCPVCKIGKIWPTGRTSFGTTWEDIAKEKPKRFEFKCDNSVCGASQYNVLVGESMNTHFED